MDIIIDFDGSCVAYKNPGMGADIGAVPVLRRLIDSGHRLILSTIRSDRDRALEDAEDWFRERDIELYGVQINPSQISWTNSKKPYGHLIIDDTALGIPLKRDTNLSNRPFIDWEKVEKILEESGIINLMLKF